MDYPVDRLEDLAIRIQQRLSNYHMVRPELNFDLPFEERTRMMMEHSANFMGTMRVEILPEVQSVLAQIESMLPNEVSSVAEALRKILSEAQVFATTPTNPLGYNELASILMKLKGQIEAITS